jgi:hypothetical protein
VAEETFLHHGLDHSFHASIVPVINGHGNQIEPGIVTLTPIPFPENGPHLELMSHSIELLSLFVVHLPNEDLDFMWKALHGSDLRLEGKKYKIRIH